MTVNEIAALIREHKKVSHSEALKLLHGAIGAKYMTKREDLAGRAMQGMLSAGAKIPAGIAKEDVTRVLAVGAIMMADAQLEALEHISGRS